jgi:MFS family permease
MSDRGRRITLWGVTVSRVLGYVATVVGGAVLGLALTSDASNVPCGSDLGGTVLGLRLPCYLHTDEGADAASLVGAAVLVVGLSLSLVALRSDRFAGARRGFHLGMTSAGLGLGYVLGACARVITAETWDANIGGGLALFFVVPPISLALIVNTVLVVLTARDKGLRSTPRR